MCGFIIMCGVLFIMSFNIQETIVKADSVIFNCKKDLFIDASKYFDNIWCPSIKSPGTDLLITLLASRNTCIYCFELHHVPL